MSWFLFHFTITHGTISKRRLILFQFFLLLLSFLNFFFFFFSFAISKSVGNPTHTRRWMTHGPCSEVKRALCSLPSQRFIASPLLFDRKLSTTSIWTSNSHSSFGKRRAFLFFLFLFLSPRQRIYIYISRRYILWIKCKSRSNEYHNARARLAWRKRKLEEREPRLWSLRTEETLSARVYLSVAF